MGVTPDFATCDEVKAAIERLTNIEWIRLRKCAQTLAHGSLYRSEDLVADAISSALAAASARQEGRKEGRAWRVDVPFIAHLMMTIRSMAFDERRSAASRSTERGVDLSEEQSPSVEDDLINMEALARAHELEVAWLEKLKQDPVVGGIIEGLGAGSRPQEIQARLGLTAAQYDAARKRLRQLTEKLRRTEKLD
jgi:hypothetical protein